MSAMPGRALLLSAVLEEIGAPEYLQAFTDDDQDDDCIGSYKKADKVSRDYGLPLQLSATFVSMCRAVILIQKDQKLTGSSRAKNTLLLAILDETGASERIQAFTDDDQDDDCIGSYKKAEKVSRDYGLPLQLSATFVSMCRAVVAMQRVIVTISAPGTSLNAASQLAEVAIFQPPHRSSSDEGAGAAEILSQLPIPPATEGHQAAPLSMGARIAAAAGTISTFFKSTKVPSNRSSLSKQSWVFDDTRGTEAPPPYKKEFASGLSGLQLAISTSVNALPNSYNQYSLDLSIADFAVLSQQLIAFPPLDRITVACCHRLTPRVRHHIRLGSTITRITLLNAKSVALQVR
jgi:hypothetical protein